MLSFFPQKKKKGETKNFKHTQNITKGKRSSEAFDVLERVAPAEHDVQNPLEATDPDVKGGGLSDSISCFWFRDGERFHESVDDLLRVLAVSNKVCEVPLCGGFVFVAVGSLLLGGHGGPDPLERADKLAGHVGAHNGGVEANDCYTQVLGGKALLLVFFFFSLFSSLALSLLSSLCSLLSLFSLSSLSLSLFSLSSLSLFLNLWPG